MNFININKVVEINNNISSKRWVMVASFLMASMMSIFILFIEIDEAKYELVKDLVSFWIMLSGASSGLVLAERGKWFNNNQSNVINNNVSTNNNNS